MQTTAISNTPPVSKAHTGYRVVIEPSAARIRAVVDGVTIADSTGVLVMHETRLAPVFYFPRADVAMDQLVRTELQTNCPFKGNASYWTLDAGGKTVENAAWSYEDPFDESSAVKDYIAFQWNAIDAWFADDVELVEQPAAAGSSKANPFVDWLVQDAWKSRSIEDLIIRLTGMLIDAGFPLWRLRLMVRTLNPQLFAIAYSWQRGSDEITEWQGSHAGLQSPQYRDSPFAVIIRGEGGIRRRLEGENPTLDFPVLHDLVAEGATDYVAMPLRFSDGQLNIVSLVSDRPGGFSTDELGRLYEILPTLSRLLEVHAQRISSLTLLRTYLGSDAGQRVMDGLVKRGDGEDLHAVIWLSDMRDSTALSESLSREDYLDSLNRYFDCVAGAVIDHGGEVLKFIGDAVLAIFVIDDAADPAPDAGIRALAAATDALGRIERVNDEHAKGGQAALRFGIGLHRGDLTFGNIGTLKRLDFTVIGPAVNQAARIEDLCKTLGKPLLISAALAGATTGELISLGYHPLRGVSVPQEIFTLPQYAADQ